MDKNLQIFFFQAEAGIRVRDVTGVQTCALPICRPAGSNVASVTTPFTSRPSWSQVRSVWPVRWISNRSEERRVGKSVERGRRRIKKKKKKKSKTTHI